MVSMLELYILSLKNVLRPGTKYFIGKCDRQIEPVEGGGVPLIFDDQERAFEECRKYSTEHPELDVGVYEIRICRVINSE